MPNPSELQRQDEAQELPRRQMSPMAVGFLLGAAVAVFVYATWELLKGNAWPSEVVMAIVFVVSLISLLRE